MGLHHMLLSALSCLKLAFVLTPGCRVVLWHSWGGLCTWQSRGVAGRAPSAQIFSWAFSPRNSLDLLWSKAAFTERDFSGTKAALGLGDCQICKFNRHVLKQALICKVLCKVIGLFPEEWLRLQNKVLCLLFISFSFAVTVKKTTARRVLVLL